MRFESDRTHAIWNLNLGPALLELDSVPEAIICFENALILFQSLEKTEFHSSAIETCQKWIEVCQTLKSKPDIKGKKVRMSYSLIAVAAACIAIGIYRWRSN